MFSANPKMGMMVAFLHSLEVENADVFETLIH